MVLRLGIEQEIPSSTEQSVKKKCVLLGRIVMQRPTEVVETIDGNTTLVEVVKNDDLRPGINWTTLLLPASKKGSWPPPVPATPHSRALEPSTIQSSDMLATTV
jgi:hypothetical protein